MAPQQALYPQDPADSTSRIPALYRVWFTWADPLPCLYTVYATWATPADFWTTYVPPQANIPWEPRLGTPLMLQLGGAYATIFVLTAFLLRSRYAGLRVWKLVQASILTTDILLLIAQFLIQRDQGRLNPADWYAADWACWGLTGWVALLRSLFVAGVGIRDPAPPAASASGLKKRA